MAPLPCYPRYLQNVSIAASCHEDCVKACAAEMVMDMTMPPPNSSTDTAMPPIAPMDISSGTPPYATSTPMRTFQMSAHLHMQSSECTLGCPRHRSLSLLDLLDQDSEMQNALQGMDSYDSAPAPKHRHSTPSLRRSAAASPRPPPQVTSPARPLSWSSHSKSHSTHNLPPVVRRGSEDLDASCKCLRGMICW